MRSPRHPRALAVITVAVGLLLAGLLDVGTAAAHGVSRHPAVGEGQLRAYETTLLGPEHAAEHAAERRDASRAARRWRRMSPAQRRRKRHRLRVRYLRNQQAMEAAAGPPAEDGAWTTAPFPIANYAIHSVLLPTGKVLFWGYPPIPDGGQRPNAGQAALWDPTLGTGPSSMKEVPPPLVDSDGDGSLEPAPLYCAAQSLLSDGEVLIAGGNQIWPSASPTDSYTDYSGSRQVFTFDPWSETWTEQPQMEHGRWYPSQVELADGRTAILGGFDETPPGAHFNPEFELFSSPSQISGVGSLQHLASADRATALYPHLFTVPSGDVLLAGPGSGDSALLNTSSFNWSNLPNASRDRFGSNAVIRPAGPGGSSTVSQIGGYGQPPTPEADRPATETIETIVASDASPSWHADTPLNIGRSWENTVLLPDASMVTVGGASGFTAADGNQAIYPDGRARQVELYDPSNDTWRLGPPEQEDRAYHSTAILLPDGRVLSAGDDTHPRRSDGTPSTSDTAEIYSPPYLFKGARPAISTAPGVLHWGDSFGISSSSPGLERAVLVAPAATTHGADMNQRYVPLQVTETLPGTGLDVLAPPSPTVAPPGYYMLFLLNDDGVPSVARWVRLTESAQPMPPAVGSSSGAPAGGQPAAGSAQNSECTTLRKRLRKVKSGNAKRKLRRRIRALGC